MGASPGCRYLPVAECCYNIGTRATQKRKTPMTLYPLMATLGVACLLATARR